MKSTIRTRSLEAAAGVLVAALAATAAAAPVTTLKRPAVAGLSDATKARLKGAGLDPADPGLAAKLKAKLHGSEAAFRGAHASSIKIVPKNPPLSSARSMGAAAPAGASSAFGPTLAAGSGARVAAPLLPGVATFVDLYLKNGQRVTGGPLDPSQPGYAYVGLFSSTKRITEVPGGPGWGGFPSVSYSGACGVHATRGGRYIASADSADFVTGSYGVTLPRRPPSGGKWYYYADFGYGGLDLGAKPHTLQVSMDLGNLGRASFSIPAYAQIVTATVTLTIDAAPPFVTSNGLGIGKSNGLFANPGETRLDPGTNPNASTTGDDKVGVAVNLGPGWSVTGAKIVAAHSVLDAPSDASPDNSYRGASVTQAPSSGRLETTVHWHYGAAESLSYTIEWQLQGPDGQRPLMTMPLGGPCDS
jgi:hypothetical protein